VLDRGGDRMRLYEPPLEWGLRFFIRLRGDRHLVVSPSRWADGLDRGVRMRYAETVVWEQAGGEKRVHLGCGFVQVRLPGRRDVELSLAVAVRGLRQESLLLLTNVAVMPTRRLIGWLVRVYLTRWLVEEAIRFIKQSYWSQALRALGYERLRKLAALVMAEAYFIAAWLGESLRLAVLASRVSGSAKTVYGVPAFHCQVQADGTGVSLSHLGHWCPL